MTRQFHVIYFAITRTEYGETSVHGSECINGYRLNGKFFDDTVKFLIKKHKYDELVILNVIELEGD